MNAAAAAAALFILANTADATAAGTHPQLTPLAADVLSPPQAVRGSDGAAHLVYELRIENITDGRFTLKRIAVIDDGRLAELGTHQELLAREGRYASLYAAWMAHHDAA